MARAVAVALLLALAVPACLAGQCLQAPERAYENDACSSEVQCTQDFYCVAGWCQPRLDVGASCEGFAQDVCRKGLKCAGESGERKCVEPVGVGQTCDPVTKPCHSGLTCDEDLNVCTGGKLGDTCLRHNDINVCAYEYDCLGGECTGVSLNQNCTITSYVYPNVDNCALGLYCDSASATCFKRKTSGRCESSLNCEYGHICVGLIEFDGFGAMYCTKVGSRKAGEYCGGEDQVCEGSLRCYNNYCSPSRLDLCSSDGECSWDEICTCDGVARASGHGRCTANKCIGAYNTRQECLAQFCGENTNDFPGSCASKHCASEMAAYQQCSGATSLSAGLGFFALVAALVHMLTRQ